MFRDRSSIVLRPKEYFYKFLLAGGAFQRLLVYHSLQGRLFLQQWYTTDTRVVDKLRICVITQTKKVKYPIIFQLAGNKTLLNLQNTQMFEKGCVMNLTNQPEYPIPH